MAEIERNTTFVRESAASQSSGAGMALIVGGLVVAVGFILWLVFGNATTVATTPGGDTTNVTIVPPTAPADPAVEPKPKADAPVDGADTTAPVTPVPVN